MRRRIINYQHGRFFNIPTEIINRADPKFTIIVRLTLISDGDVIGAENAEDVYFFIALRKNFNLLIFCLPSIRHDGCYIVCAIKQAAKYASKGA